ncbi:MAG: hypothetical protein NZM12_00105, partial [Steroidobacteraceae bacterium]|nr:hypothetical protein [Steroidobacteraceae bacterium]
CATLLVTLEYPQERMAGPPFSVTADEVDALYGAEHTIECLSRDPQPADAGKFAARGVDRLAECVYLLRRR